MLPTTGSLGCHLDLRFPTFDPLANRPPQAACLRLFGEGYIDLDFLGNFKHW